MMRYALWVYAVYIVRDFNTDQIHLCNLLPVQLDNWQPPVGGGGTGQTSPCTLLEYFHFMEQSGNNAAIIMLLADHLLFCQTLTS